MTKDKKYMRRIKRVFSLMLTWVMVLSVAGSAYEEYTAYDGGRVYGAGNAEMADAFSPDETAIDDVEDDDGDADRREAPEDPSADDELLIEDLFEEDFAVGLGEDHIHIEADTEDDQQVELRTLQAELEEELLYNLLQEATEPLAGVNKLWHWYWGRDAREKLDADEDEPLDAQGEPIDPLRVEVTGMLPGNVTAQASFIPFDEGDTYSESALFSFRLGLYDENGVPYIPEGKITICVGGYVISEAVEDEQSLLVYAYEEDAKREDPRIADDYKANVLAYRDRGQDQGKSQQEISDGLHYQTDQKKDAVVFSEDKVGLAVSGAAGEMHDISFEAESVPLQFIVSAMRPERTLVGWSDDGWSSVFVKGALAEDTRVVFDIQQAGQLTDQIPEADQVAPQDEVLLGCEISLMDEDSGAYQPDAPVQVTIHDVLIGDALADGAELAVWSLADAGEAACIDGASFAGDTVTFEAQTLGTYAVMSSVLEKTITASDGQTYQIAVAYDQAAHIPDGAELAVSEILQEQDQAAYDSYLTETAQALGVLTGAVSYARVFDISIVKDGEKVAPDAPVDVQIRLLDREKEAAGEAGVIGSDLSGLEENEWDETGTSGMPEVVHFGDEIERMDCTGDGDTVTFSTDGFSVYVVAYTVDFYWGDYTYHMEGESQIRLSELLEALQISEITLQDVERVLFSDDSLVKVEQDGEDWLLTSLRAFDTQESLTLALVNGENVRIKVTDEVQVEVHVIELGTNGQIVEHDSDWRTDDHTISLQGKTALTTLLPEAKKSMKSDVVHTGNYAGMNVKDNASFFLYGKCEGKLIEIRENMDIVDGEIIIDQNGKLDAKEIYLCVVKGLRVEAYKTDDGENWEYLEGSTTDLWEDGYAQGSEEKTLVKKSNDSGPIVTTLENSGSYQKEGYKYAYAVLGSDSQVVIKSIRTRASHQYRDSQRGKDIYAYTWQYKSVGTDEFRDLGNDSIVLRYNPNPVSVPIYWVYEEEITGRLVEIPENEMNWYNQGLTAPKTAVVGDNSDYVLAKKESGLATTDWVYPNLDLLQTDDTISYPYQMYKDGGVNPDGTWHAKYQFSYFAVGMHDVDNASKLTQKYADAQAMYLRMSENGVAFANNAEMKDALSSYSFGLYVVYDGRPGSKDDFYMTVAKYWKEGDALQSKAPENASASMTVHQLRQELVNVEKTEDDSEHKGDTHLIVRDQSTPPIILADLFFDRGSDLLLSFDFQAAYSYVNIYIYNYNGGSSYDQHIVGGSSNDGTKYSYTITPNTYQPLIHDDILTVGIGPDDKARQGMKLQVTSKQTDGVKGEWQWRENVDYHQSVSFSGNNMIERLKLPGTDEEGRPVRYYVTEDVNTSIPTEYSYAYHINDLGKDAEHPVTESGRTVAIVNAKSTKYIARVSTDGGNTWPADQYFERLITETVGERTITGAFDFAQEQDGDVIIETLLASSDYYTLGTKFTFSKKRKITLRTTEDPQFNPAEERFKTTIIKNQETGAMLVIGSDVSMFSIRNIVLDGGQKNYNERGGIIRLEEGTKLDVENGCVLKNGKADRGGAICGLGKNVVTITGDVTFLGNEGIRDGGAINLDHCSELRVQGTPDHEVTFAENMSGVDGGGAINLSDNKNQNQNNVVEIEQALFENNSSHGAGGAIRICENSRVTLATVSFINNQSFASVNKDGKFTGEGGAIAVLSAQNHNASTLTVQGGSFVRNGVVTSDDILLQEKEKNTLAVHGGGAVKMGGYGTLYIKNGTLFGGAADDGNYARNGGAIVVEPGASAYIEDTVHISYNHADLSGGGIYVNSNENKKSSLTLRGGDISNNRATDGAGIYAGNNAALTADANDRVVGIKANVAIANGGGIYLDQNTSFKGNGALRISENESKNGGGIYADHSELELKGDASIIENTALLIDGEPVYSGNGGGIHAENGCVIRVESGTKINQNVADGRGGGIYTIFGENIVSIKDNAQIMLNVAKNSNGDGQGGGGLYISFGSVEMLGGKISDNKALSSDGGGVFLANGGTAFSMKGSAEISRNGSRDGGGICLVNEAKLEMNGGSVNDNHAERNGGGIYQGSTSPANIQSGSVLKGDSAGKMGGGIYVGSKKGLLINNASMEQCSAILGGGIAAIDASVQITDLRMMSCMVNPTINEEDQDEQTVDNVSETDYRGGGIYAVGSEGSLVISGSTVITKCQAQNDGGAIYAEHDLTVTGSDSNHVIIDQCSANRGGGGINVSYWGATVHLSYCSITNCGANTGGGVNGFAKELDMKNSLIEGSNATWNGGALLLNRAEGTVLLENTDIRGCTATHQGAAIYIADGVKTKLQGGSITGNSCQFPVGGAVNIIGNQNAKSNARLSLAGGIVIYDNLDASQQQKNVYLELDQNDAIYAEGLTNQAKIGVYVANPVDSLEIDVFNKHGNAGDPFGTYTSAENLDHFVNDINQLKGMKKPDDSKIVIWEPKPAYIRVENRTGKNCYFRLYVYDDKNDPYSEMIQKKGSENQEPISAKIDKDQSYYDFKLSKAVYQDAAYSYKSETFCLPHAAGYRYQLRVYEENASGQELTYLTGEDIKLLDSVGVAKDASSDELSGELVAGPDYVVYGKNDYVSTDPGKKADSYDKNHADNCYKIAVSSGQYRSIVLVDVNNEIVIRKTNGYGYRLTGAEFTLYSDEQCTQERKITFQNSETSKVTTDASGTLVFHAPVGVTYMKETTVPAGYQTMKAFDASHDDVYRIIVGEEKARELGIQLKEGESFFVQRRRNGGAWEDNPNTNGIMNVSTVIRKVILKKVDETNFSPLSGAEFEIMTYDRTVIRTGLRTSASGVYFTDGLPLGTYYLRETTFPSNYKTDRPYYILKVMEDEVDITGPYAQIPDITLWKTLGSVTELASDKWWDSSDAAKALKEAALKRLKETDNAKRKEADVQIMEMIANYFEGMSKQEAQRILGDVRINPNNNPMLFNYCIDGGYSIRIANMDTSYQPYFLDIGFDAGIYNTSGTDGWKVVPEYKGKQTNNYTSKFLFTSDEMLEKEHNIRIRFQIINDHLTNVYVFADGLQTQGFTSQKF